jgi:raffinose/stachyose/melibiose transport system permease protein
MFAALTLIILPGIIIYAVSQEQVQVSITSGSVKG